MDRDRLTRARARLPAFVLPLLLVSQAALPGFAQSDAAPRGLTTRPMSQAPAMGNRPAGAPPTDAQCTNLLSQAEKVPALRESPDYAYCKSRSR